MNRGVLPSTNHGVPPAGTDTENIYALLYDTLWYIPGATLTEKNLCKSDENKIEQYRYGLFTDISQMENVEIHAIRCTHNMQFAARSSEPALITQMYFENFSRLKISFLSKERYPIPLAAMVPYDIVYNGSAANMLARNNPLFRFREPLYIPQGGNLQMKFDPADSLTAAAAGVTNPQLPGQSLTNDRAFWIKFDFFGKTRRIKS